MSDLLTGEGPWISAHLSVRLSGDSNGGLTDDAGSNGLGVS
jgi:hypothetical protein